MISVLFSFLLVIVKATNNNNEITLHNNLRKDTSKKDLLIESNNVNITITNITYEEREINLYINPESELQNNLTFLITLYIDKYDDYLGFWLSKEIEVRACDYYGISIFSAYVEDLTFDNLTLDIFLAILNITIDNSNANNTYNVYFDQLEFNFQEENSISIINYLSPPDFEGDGDNVNVPISTDNSESSINSESSSGSLSTGIIIGIIAGGVLIIGAIITTIICLCKKKNNNTMNESSNKEIITEEDIIFDQLQKIKNKGNNIIKLFFETQSQKIKIEFEIDGYCSLEEMRNQFFEKINRIDLKKDKDIYFLFGGNGFPINKKGLVKNFFKQGDKDN